MKKNTLFLFAFYLLIACGSKEQKAEPPVEKPVINDTLPKHIGLIEFDPSIDTLSFEVCHEDFVYAHFHHKYLSIQGEKPTITNEFQERFKPSSTPENGFITIRFIVNCEGKTGRFRMIEMDENYELKTFSEELSSQIFGITKSLEGWDILDEGGTKLDYTRYLTFRIQDGKITDILP